MKEQCRGLVWRDYSNTRCRCTGTLEHEGKWYCKKHHPPSIEAYTAERNARREAKWSEQDKARAAAQREQALKDRALEWMTKHWPELIEHWRTEL